MSNTGDQDKRAELERMFQSISKNFPEVPITSVRQLQQWVSAPQPAAVVVDVRDTHEQQVSIIPSARTKQEFQQQKDQLKNLPVVCYCTLGYRSGQYAQELQKEGFNSQNLEGGIIGWTQQGGKLTQPGSSNTDVSKVHVWSAKFAGLQGDGVEAVHYGPVGTIRSLLSSLWPRN